MPIRNSVRPLTETYAWLDEREDWIFERYMELGSAKKVYAECRKMLLEYDGKPTGHEAFFNWLIHEDERRAKRWERARSNRAHISFDEAGEEAEGATQQDANARRLKWNHKIKAAEFQNRSVYGKTPDVSITNINASIAEDWAKALDSLEEHRAKQIPEAEVISITESSEPVSEAKEAPPTSQDSSAPATGGMEDV